MPEPQINLATCSYYNHVENDQRNCLENQLTGVYLKITLTANELSITNHEAYEYF